MPLYFFNIQDGPERLTDRSGVALPDTEAAWYQGIRSAREIIDRDFRVGAVRSGRCMHIQDETGAQVWAVPFEEVIGLAV